LDPARIADVYYGNANGAGEENRNVGRMAALLVGLPTSAPGMTVNQLCATGLKAVVQVARAIAVGDASIADAGGVDSNARRIERQWGPRPGFDPRRAGARQDSNPPDTALSGA
jgi:acetyl-CoA acyltransferase